MLTYIIRQILYSILIILGVMTVTFFVIRVLPGDPSRIIQGQRSDVNTTAALRAEWKLDRPLPEQYWDFISRSFQGDLGKSFFFNRPVLDTLLEKMLPTFWLSITALFLSSIIGIAIGVVSAWKPYTFFDNSSMVVALLGISVPAFVMGHLLALIFSHWLGWFEGTGYFYKNGGFDIRFLVLPMIALAARPLSIIARITRSAMLDVMGQDYIRTARAKGVPIAKTVMWHGLRNALNPVITTISAWLAGTLAGTLFIEQIFGWPGIGQLAFDAVKQLDFPVIQGTVLFTAVVFVLINLLVDVLYALLDPKVRLS
jgi:peptide/nickel transport system permease protein